MSFLPDDYDKEPQTIESRLSKQELLMKKVLATLKPIYHDWKRRNPDEKETLNTPEAIKESLNDIPF